MLLDSNLPRRAVDLRDAADTGFALGIPVNEQDVARKQLDSTPDARHKPPWDVPESTEIRHLLAEPCLLHDGKVREDRMPLSQARHARKSFYCNDL